MRYNRSIIYFRRSFDFYAQKLNKTENSLGFIDETFVCFINKMISVLFDKCLIKSA